MITIVCGEDNSASREYYNTLKAEFEKKGSTVQFVTAKDVPTTVRPEEHMNLFGNPVVYFTEGLNTYVSRAGRTIPQEYEIISKDKTVQLVDWEDGKGSRELKIAKLGTVKEFKPSKTIFSFLDLITPGKRKEFIELLDVLRTTNDEQFIFTMIVRHMRSLILAHQGLFNSRVQPWQRGKLSAQAKAWDQEKLVGFYEGLYRIDSSLKTGGTPYSLKKSLDILACYYL